jgi:hypothetical protein
MCKDCNITKINIFVTEKEKAMAYITCPIANLVIEIET